MANYMNKLVDPNVYSQQNMQNMLNVMQLQETRKRNALMQKQDKRAQADFDVRMTAVPFEFRKIKTRHISKMAQQISALPKQQRSSRYFDLVTKVAPKPIAEHPQLGQLGVADKEDFLDPSEFSKLTDDQQVRYLDVVSHTADEIAKIRLNDRKAADKEQQILMEANAKLEQIRAKSAEDIKLARVKGEEARKTELVKTKKAGTDKTQTRIDKLHKEIASLASKREQIRKGDKLDMLGRIMASTTGDSSFNMKPDEGVEAAIKKLDEYEKWIRKELKKYEPETKKNSDPLGILNKTLKKAH